MDKILVHTMVGLVRGGSVQMLRATVVSAGVVRTCACSVGWLCVGIVRKVVR